MNTEQFKKMFNCDKARISIVGDKMFLFIGFNKNTKDDQGQWVNEKGEVKNWDYVSEQCVASGKNGKELIESAKKYKELESLTWKDFFDDKGINQKNCDKYFKWLVA